MLVTMMYACARVSSEHLNSALLHVYDTRPVLFSGTVRYNLDPFNELEDHQLWDEV